MKRLSSQIALLPSVVLACIWGACGTVKEPQQQSPPQPPQKIGFEVQTDTIRTQAGTKNGEVESAGKNSQIRYMVQIGAYKDAQNASATQLRARERFSVPIVNEFQEGTGLYQIRLGFFETKKEAYDFRKKIRKDYPKDYWDAWVVEAEE